MLDMDFLLIPSLAHYFLSTPQGKDRALAFLNTDAVLQEGTWPVDVVTRDGYLEAIFILPYAFRCCSFQDRGGYPYTTGIGTARDLLDTRRLASIACYSPFTSRHSYIHYFTVSKTFFCFQVFCISITKQLIDLGSSVILSRSSLFCVHHYPMLLSAGWKLYGLVVCPETCV
jgi:hypothetical protein